MRTSAIRLNVLVSLAYTRHVKRMSMVKCSLQAYSASIWKGGAAFPRPLAGPEVWVFVQSRTIRTRVTVERFANAKAYETYPFPVRLPYIQVFSGGSGVFPIESINARLGLQAPENPDPDSPGRRGSPRSASRMESVPVEEITPLLPYDIPPKIWLIGLNYKSHAEDINAVQPEEPGSFMKPASCMFEPEGTIELPPPEVSNDVDAEGELAIVLGRTCRYVPSRICRGRHFRVYGNAGSDGS